MNKKNNRKFFFYIFLLFLIVTFVSCNVNGIFNAAKGLIPKLKSGLPNIVYGTWAVESNYEGYYKYKLKLDSDSNYTLTDGENNIVHGRYEINYSYLDILQSSGKITFYPSLNNYNTSESTDFSYFADVVYGPEKLKLHGKTLSEEFLFLER